MNTDKAIKNLPLSRQIALWVILKMEDSKNETFKFKSSEFSKAFKDYANKNLISSENEYGKFVGAILSGLKRHGLLIRLTGDRDKHWTLSEEIKINHKEYYDSLFKMKVYWN